MDHTELRKLVRLMKDNDLIELQVEQEGSKVILRKAGPPQVMAAQAQAALPLLPQAAAAPAAPAPAAAPAAEDGAPAAPPPGTKDILSPMVGTFYRRPSPESDPFVSVGDRVDSETVICIVEAMKVNNEIKAEMSGEIVEVLVEDGHPVEFDQPLFRVKTG